MKFEKIKKIIFHKQLFHELNIDFNIKQITSVHTCHEARTARYYLWGIEVIFHSIFCSRNFSCCIKIVTFSIEEVTRT